MHATPVREAATNKPNVAALLIVVLSLPLVVVLLVVVVAVAYLRHYASNLPCPTHLLLPTHTQFPIHFAGRDNLFL